jgi:hypothetical protein
MPTPKPEPCGCTLRKGKLEEQCEFHKKRDVLIMKNVAIWLESKINSIFKDTHLYKIKDEILNEIKRLKK